MAWDLVPGFLTPLAALQLMDGISVSEGHASEETCSQRALYDLCSEVGYLGALGNPSQAPQQAGDQPQPETCKGTGPEGRGEAGCLAQVPLEVLGGEWGQLKEGAVSLPSQGHAALRVFPLESGLDPAPSAP